jgi:hypothetical protein
MALAAWEVSWAFEPRDRAATFTLQWLWSSGSIAKLRWSQDAVFVVVSVLDDVGAHHQILQQRGFSVVVAPERLLAGPQVGDRSQHDAPRRDHRLVAVA